jgi:hypothetical protein
MFQGLSIKHSKLKDGTGIGTGSSGKTEVFGKSHPNGLLGVFDLI